MTWRIWASNEIEKIKDEKEFQKVRLCPFTGDYCISKCRFYYAYKGSSNCYLVTLAKALNDIRFKMVRR